MILLDTNVVSEPIRKRPNARVMAWLDAVPEASLYLCTPVLAEIRFGVERLPAGMNRNYLEQWSQELEQVIFVNRIMAVDVVAAHEFGRSVAHRQRIGRRIEPMDALIAAIALTNRMALATRDTGGFADLGLDLINPFAEAGASSLSPP